MTQGCGSEDSCVAVHEFGEEEPTPISIDRHHLTVIGFDEGGEDELVGMHGSAEEDVGFWAAEGGDVGTCGSKDFARAAEGLDGYCITLFGCFEDVECGELFIGH